MREFLSKIFYHIIFSVITYIFALHRIKKNELSHLKKEARDTIDCIRDVFQKSSYTEHAEQEFNFQVTRLENIFQRKKFKNKEKLLIEVNVLGAMPRVEDYLQHPNQSKENDRSDVPSEFYSIVKRLDSLL